MAQTSIHDRALVRDAAAVRAARDSAHELHWSREDYDPLLELIGESRVVLLGEASHGTHEFYRARAEITRRLIEEKGFCAVAVEADWPDAYRINRYVRGIGPDESAVEALGDFLRFPRWMWRNTDVRDFIAWLRSHNDGVPQAGRVGFYGLDLYSLFASIEAVLKYLRKVDPEAAQRARQRYACFEMFGENPQAYGHAVGLNLSKSCEDAAVSQLLELRQKASDYAWRDGRVAADELFHAEQNARLVIDAERYYRAMFADGVNTWNLRDRHMADTLHALLSHLDAVEAASRRLDEALVREIPDQVLRPGPGQEMRRGSGQALRPEPDRALRPGAGAAKVVVWAHNSHIGDARATEMSRRGELNLGQLARERYARGAVTIGFTTFTGTVTAADDWDEPARRKRVRPGLPESWESLFHLVSQERLVPQERLASQEGAAGMPSFLLNVRDEAGLREALREPRLERFIGVIYRPETERWSHYSHARLPDQFDAVLHYDETRAVEPLDAFAGTEDAEPPETFPTGM